MNIEQRSQEIRDANVTYLVLAQRMLRDDRVQALFQLGISETIADLIAALTMAQILTLASQNMLLCRFRHDSEMTWKLLTSHAQDGAVATGIHAAILTSGPAANT